MRLFIHDDLPPEAGAMLQALYSRSADSVQNHIPQLRERGPDRFMRDYYVGYGHESIGDCGYTTLYIEDVSILACKAVQDNRLYSGQETSTRYIDFSHQGMVDPLGTAASSAILQRWISFYAKWEQPLKSWLTGTIDKPENTSQKQWEKAIAARSFDILRGFIPAGIKSQLAWTTNLRQAHEHVLRLQSHPLEEMRALGGALRELLRARYPSSFSHSLSKPELAYRRKVAEKETWLPQDVAVSEGGSFSSNLDVKALEAEAGALISDRPRRCALPKSLERFGAIDAELLLDFGSYRDLQRHRGGYCHMPLLTTNYGFHPWYLSQLPARAHDEAMGLLKEQEQALDGLRKEGANTGELQYYIAMGYQVRCRLIYDLPQAVYVAELRSGTTVHPTLRVWARQLLDWLHATIPGMELHGDRSPDGLSVKRGEQDITKAA